MSATNLAFKQEPTFEIGDQPFPMQQTGKKLYLIQYKKNTVNNEFGNVLMFTVSAKWEPWGSYETEAEMLYAFDKVCKEQNVVSGLYKFRCLWPDGRTRESQEPMHA